MQNVCLLITAKKWNDLVIKDNDKLITVKKNVIPVIECYILNNIERKNIVKKIN